jgi:hypothetical protein
MPNTFGTVYEVEVGDWYDELVNSLKIGNQKILKLPIMRIPGLFIVGFERHGMDAILRALEEQEAKTK